MTVEVSAAAMVASGAAALIAVTGYVVRVLVLDRIKALETRVEKQGERFGEDVKSINKWQAAHDAVDDERRERRRHDTKGIPIGEG